MRLTDTLSKIAQKVCSKDELDVSQPVPGVGCGTRDTQAQHLRRPLLSGSHRCGLSNQEWVPPYILNSNGLTCLIQSQPSSWLSVSPSNCAHISLTYPPFSYHLSLYAIPLYSLQDGWEVGWGSYSHSATSNLFTLYTYCFQLVLVLESMADSHLLKDMGWISLGRMQGGPSGFPSGDSVPIKWQSSFFLANILLLPSKEHCPLKQWPCVTPGISGKALIHELVGEGVGCGTLL